MRIDDGCFTLVYEGEGLIEASLWGIWTPSDALRFAQEFDAFAARAREINGKPVDILVDTTRLNILSQEASAVFNGTAERYAGIIRKSAIVMTSALHKMQVKRLNVSDHEIFSEVSEALAWLKK